MLPRTDEYKPPPDESIPKQIGRYCILERIGTGGMGTVYKAHDPQLDRVVALKLPRFDGTPDKLAVRIQRFQREGRAAAQVLHPHICPIFDVGEHDGQPYVVMAYIEGKSLAKRLAEQGRYEDVGEAVALIRQVLDGLEAVHTHGIIHRDLKPANILVDQAGRAILTDFGLARPKNDAEHLTLEGVIIGTPAYMAPEQAAGQSERIGPWTDLYSVGVVLYQMLTGRLPFEGPLAGMLSKIVHEAPPAPCSLRAELDAALEAIVLIAMAREPVERYQSARRFAEALEGWLQKGSLKTTPPAAVPNSEPQANQALTVPALRSPSRKPTGWNSDPLVAGIIGVILFVGAHLVPVFFEEVLVSGSYLFLAIPLLFTGLYIIRRAALAQDYWRQRRLMKAAADGQSDAVEVNMRTHLLVRTQLNVNGKDELGETALMKAVANGHSAIVKILLAGGAEVNEKNRFGQTALMMAMAKGHQDIVELLKQAGARE